MLHTGKTADVMDFIKGHEAQDFSNTRYGLQPVEGVGIMLLGGFEDREFEVFEQLIIVGDQGDVDLDGLLHGRFLKAFGYPVSVGLVSDLFADVGQIVLAVGILDMSQEFGAFAVVAAREAGRRKVGYRGITVADLDRVLREETPRLGLWLDSSTFTVVETVDYILANLSAATVL